MPGRCVPYPKTVAAMTGAKASTGALWSKRRADGRMQWQVMGPRGSAAKVDGSLRIKVVSERADYSDAVSVEPDGVHLYLAHPRPPAPRLLAQEPCGADVLVWFACEHGQGTYLRMWAKKMDSKTNKLRKMTMKKVGKKKAAAKSYGS